MGLRNVRPQVALPLPMPLSVVPLGHTCPRYGALNRDRPNINHGSKEFSSYRRTFDRDNAHKRQEQQSAPEHQCVASHSSFPPSTGLYWHVGWFITSPACHMHTAYVSWRPTGTGARTRPALGTLVHADPTGPVGRPARVHGEVLPRQRPRRVGRAATGPVAG